MEKEVQQFLNQTKQKKLEALMGLNIDLQYLENFLKDNDEDTLRDRLAIVTDELKEEQKKIGFEIRKGKGGIKPDTRDISKITALSIEKQSLNVRIDRAVSTKQKILEFKGIEKDILAYVSLLQNLDKEFLDSLDKIANL